MLQAHPYYNITAFCLPALFQEDVESPKDSLLDDLQVVCQVLWAIAKPICIPTACMQADTCKLSLNTC